MAKRFLILGGAGYLGARIAERLAARGDVTVTARRLTPIKEAWAKALKSRIHLKVFESHSHAVTAIEGEYDCILNLATPSSAEAAKDPAAARSGAIASVEAALHFIKEGSAKRLIHFSSFHVYGNPGQAGYQETDFPKPTHPYGEAHLACEENLRALEDASRIVVLRPTNIVGAPAHGDLGLQENLFFLDCCRQAAETGAIQIRNDGGAQRDFLPFADALSAIERLATAEIITPGLYNLALGKSQPLKHFLTQIQSVASERLRKDVSVTYGEGKDPFSKPFRVTTGALTATGWKPSGDFATEISETIAFYRRGAGAASLKRAGGAK